MCLREGGRRCWFSTTNPFVISSPAFSTKADIRSWTNAVQRGRRFNGPCFCRALTRCICCSAMSCYGEKYDKCALRAPHTFPESCFAQKTEQLNQTPKVLLPEVKHSWQLAKHFCDVEYAPNEMENGASKTRPLEKSMNMVYQIIINCVYAMRRL